MEEILDLYEQPYDPAQPVVCFDERPCQLLREVRPSLPAAPGRPARRDVEYQRNGTANVFGYFEPLRGRRVGWPCIPLPSMGDIETLRQETEAWDRTRNRRAVKLDWQFRTADACIKLRRLYPTVAD